MFRRVERRTKTGRQFCRPPDVRPGVPCEAVERGPANRPAHNRRRSPPDDPDPMNQQALSALIWLVADLLRGDFKQSEYGRVILPFTVLRRLDCVLAPTLPRHRYLHKSVGRVRRARHGLHTPASRRTRAPGGRSSPRRTSARGRRCCPSRTRRSSRSTWPANPPSGGRCARPTWISRAATRTSRRTSWPSDSGAARPSRRTSTRCRRGSRQCHSSFRRSSCPCSGRWCVTGAGAANGGWCGRAAPRRPRPAPSRR